MATESITSPQVSACPGVLVVYAPGEGRCDLGHECAVYELRWTDHDGYLAAHVLRAVPGECDGTEPG